MPCEMRDRMPFAMPAVRARLVYCARRQSAHHGPRAPPSCRLPWSPTRPAPPKHRAVHAHWTRGSEPFYSNKVHTIESSSLEDRWCPLATLLPPLPALARASRLPSQPAPP
eukprot:369013-Prymnesium_polylepis.1